MTPIVLGGSAGVELALQTPIGRRLHVKLPVGAVSWVPEHYFVEAVAVLRRLELHRTCDEVRIQLAMDRCEAPQRFARDDRQQARRRAHVAGGDDHAVSALKLIPRCGPRRPSGRFR